MTKMFPFERAISLSYLVPIVTKALFLSVFSQLNLLQTNGQTDKDDLDDARIRACIGCKTRVPKREQRALLDESCNSKPVLRSQIMVCAGVHLVTVWSQFFLFFISNILAEQTPHLYLYMLD